jgi:Na+-transporting methylmalonyl-CoA/oxaloacetate decarboxylase gamma subunit
MTISSWLSSLTILFSGMLFVMGVLCLIYLLCLLVGRIFASRPSVATPLPPKPASQTQAPIAPINREDVPVVIAAAIHELLRGQNFKIIAIRPTYSSDWAREGRTTIFNSHKR